MGKPGKSRNILVRHIEPLAAVEVQLPSGLLFFHSKTYGVQNKSNRLLVVGLVRDDTVVRQITDN